jgi:hypothetical protein
MQPLLAQIRQKKSGLAQKSTKPRVWVSQEETLRVASQAIAEYDARGLENFVEMEQIRHSVGMD